MKRFSKLLAMLAIAALAFSCVKEGHVAYRFELRNATDMPITVHLSSWGGYAMFINGIYDSEYKFHQVESIKPYSELIFSADVGDNPNPYTIPLSLTPAWEHITAIECDGVTIPSEYFTNPKNWEIGVAHQLNGTFTSIQLIILPELLEQFRP